MLSDIWLKIRALFTRYTWKNVCIDSVIWSNCVVDNCLFYNSNVILSEYNRIFNMYIEADKNEDNEEATKYYNAAYQYILNNVERNYYEYDIQDANIVFVVKLAIHDLIDTIKIIKNIDGERSKQYFADFAIDENQLYQSLMQKIKEVIYQGHSASLEYYLLTLDNLKAHGGFINDLMNRTTGGEVGKGLLTGAIAGAAAFLNPLVGLGVFAKGMYDNYQDREKIDKVYEVKKKFNEAMSLNEKSEKDILPKVNEILSEVIYDAYDEIRKAVNQYCRSYKFSARCIEKEIYKFRKLYFGKNPNINDTIVKKIVNVCQDALCYTDFHPGMKVYCKKIIGKYSE